MFRYLRCYSLTSIVIILAAAGLATSLYRQATIRWFSNAAEREHVVLAQTVLNFVKPGLAAYLASKPQDALSQTELATTLGKLTRDNSITGIAVYERRGTMSLYAHAGQTGHSAQTGANPGDAPGINAAANGVTFSNMKYRDIFNRILGSTVDDNLMKTFVPIRQAPTGPVVGIFEMYTDMTPLILANERLFIVTLLGSGFVFALLYGVFAHVVQREKDIIEVQQKDIRARTANLETLSRQLLDSDEQQKKKIAFDLHEGIAQTLAALKLNAENNHRNSEFATLSPESFVHVLQGAIHEVRNIATELRPSSLDDFGLLSTIDGFCREFERVNPKMRVEQEHSMQEIRVPESLKIVIYRIVKSAFNIIAFNSNTDQVRIALQQADNTITLTISDIPTALFSAVNLASQDFNPRQRFSEMHDRTLLSGGEFTAKLGKANEITLRSSWAC